MPVRKRFAGCVDPKRSSCGQPGILNPAGHFAASQALRYCYGIATVLLRYCYGAARCCYGDGMGAKRGWAGGLSRPSPKSLPGKGLAFLCDLIESRGTL
jgi:hypothetical protein